MKKGPIWPFTFTNATNISFLATKNSGLVATIATSFLYVGINNGYLRRPYVLLENHIERSSLRKHSTYMQEKKSIHPFTFLYWFSHIGKLPNGWLCLKSPYNALQALGHWLHHVGLCTVLLTFKKGLHIGPLYLYLATRQLHLATSFYQLLNRAAVGWVFSCSAFGLFFSCR